MQVSVPEQFMILIIEITARRDLGNQSSHADIGYQRYRDHHHRSLQDAPGEIAGMWLS
jgi:hypothetical protein